MDLVGGDVEVEYSRVTLGLRNFVSADLCVKSSVWVRSQRYGKVLYSPTGDENMTNKHSHKRVHVHIFMSPVVAWGRVLSSTVAELLIARTPYQTLPG